MPSHPVVAGSITPAATTFAFRSQEGRCVCVMREVAGITWAGVCVCVMREVAGITRAGVCVRDEGGGRHHAGSVCV